MDTKTRIKLKSQCLVILAVLILVLISYFKIFTGFFQHDEWQTFASAYLNNYEGIPAVLRDSFVPRASHFAPLFSLVFNLLFMTFGLNYMAYAVISLLFHLLVVLLVFVFTLHLTKKTIIAFVSALLFGINASSHQATTWIIANINTHGATIFALLSLIFLFRFLKDKKSKSYVFFSSLIFLIISLLFKEIAIGFFALLPIIFIFFSETKQVKERIAYPLILFGLGIVYLALRLLMLTMPVSDGEFVVVKDQSIGKIAFNTVTFPAKIFAQSVIPTEQLMSISKVTAGLLPDSIAGRPQTSEFDRFVEKRILQILDLLIFILAVIAAFWVWKSRLEQPLKKAVLLGFIFTIINSFIYALSPGRPGSIPVIDSRNIYLPSIGTAVFISTTVYSAMKGKKMSLPAALRSGYPLAGTIRVILVLMPLILLQIYWLNKQFEVRSSLGEVRKGILEQIKRDHPDLPKRVVFYVQSDAAYYGMVEKIPPFETGLGQALLVWYHPTEKFPSAFFENRFLRFITDQGYREVGSRGFGYFRDRDLLVRTIRQYNIPAESIISYRYHGETNILEESKN